jgi:predicted outer membrane repeat protein
MREEAVWLREEAIRLRENSLRARDDAVRGREDVVSMSELLNECLTASPSASPSEGPTISPTRTPTATPSVAYVSTVAELVDAMSTSASSTDIVVLTNDLDMSSMTSPTAYADFHGFDTTPSGGYGYERSFIHIGRNVTLRGSCAEAASAICRLNAGGSRRHFIIANNLEAAPLRVIFENIEFFNGRVQGSGGQYVYGGSVHMNNVQATFVDCIFTNNFASQYGGAIHANAQDAICSFVACTFSGNSAGWGFDVVAGSATVHFAGSNIVDGHEIQSVSTQAVGNRQITYNTNLIYESPTGSSIATPDDPTQV